MSERPFNAFENIPVRRAGQMPEPPPTPDAEGENPFAAPRTELAPLQAAQEGINAPLYVVAPAKFHWLFIGTLGLYSLYWFYRQWRSLKQARGLNVWPVPRAIFSIFFVHGLMREVSAIQAEQDLDRAQANKSKATMVVILMVVSYVIGKLTGNNVGYPLLDLVEIAMTIALSFACVTLQSEVNLAAGDPEGLDNNRLSAANIVWIVIGGLLWVLILVGLFFGQVEA